MNAELIVLKYLRDAAGIARRRGSAAVARVALAHEERLSRQIERIEAEEAGRAAQQPAPEAAAA